MHFSFTGDKILGRGHETRVAGNYYLATTRTISIQYPIIRADGGTNYYYSNWVHIYIYNCIGVRAVHCSAPTTSTVWSSRLVIYI